MCISEQPFSQAPHWAMVVFPAVGGPYNTGKFMCRTSAIHLRYNWREYIAAHERIAGPAFNSSFSTAKSKKSASGVVDMGS